VGEAAAVRQQRLARVAIGLVLGMASSTSWPFRRFFNSAVKIGMPFKNGTRSRLFSFFTL